MKRRRVILGAAWLAIVCTGIALVIVRREGWGIWEIGALVIGGALLVLFVTDFVLDRGSTGSTRVGDYATLALLMGALLVLGVFLVAGLFTLSVTQSLVVGVFLLVFVRILRDYLRELRKRRAGPDR